MTPLRPEDAWTLQLRGHAEKIAEERGVHAQTAVLAERERVVAAAVALHAELIEAPIFQLIPLSWYRATLIARLTPWPPPRRKRREAA